MFFLYFLAKVAIYSSTLISDDEKDDIWILEIRIKEQYGYFRSLKFVFNNKINGRSKEKIINFLTNIKNDEPKNHFERKIKKNFSYFCIKRSFDLKMKKILSINASKYENQYKLYGTMINETLDKYTVFIAKKLPEKANLDLFLLLVFL
ncbi:hypothetical protein GVAV_000688 [Gurleya vavrai]